MTSTIEQSLDLSVPVRSAYNQWTQFRDFPLFMPGVTGVEQVDDQHLEWRAKIGGKEHEWKVEICEQIPDKRVAWKSLSGPWNAGVVTFHRIDDDQSRLMVQLEYEPEGLVQTAREKLGLARSRLEKELAGFKEFIETRGKETGAWRGTIPNKEERCSSSDPAD